MDDKSQAEWRAIQALLAAAVAWDEATDEEDLDMDKLDALTDALGAAIKAYRREAKKEPTDG